MKFTIKLASGSTLDFEGNAEEFDQVKAFLSDPPTGFVASSVEATDPLEEDDRDGGDDELDALDPRNVQLRIDEVGARTDMEKVTVMAQLAVEAGEEGLDYPTVERLYVDLGFRKPARFPKTFSNAKNAGLVRSVKYGVWRPTVRGENFARGLGRARDSTRRTTGRNGLPSDNGGESD
jgi:hypothetical protein